MAMYAGCGVGDISDVTVAARIVGRLMANALPLLSYAVLRGPHYLGNWA
jgi:hypothetical protein